MKEFIKKLFEKTIIININGIFLGIGYIPIKRISREKFEELIIEKDYTIHYFA